MVRQQARSSCLRLGSGKVVSVIVAPPGGVWKGKRGGRSGCSYYPNPAGGVLGKRPRTRAAEPVKEMLEQRLSSEFPSIGLACCGFQPWVVAFPQGFSPGCN